MYIMIYKTVKRSLCFLSFLFPSFVSTNAQNTLSLAANLMQPGDSVTKERVEYVYSGEYGNHAVWDFSNLETEDIYCIKYDTISESQLIGYDMQKTYNYRFTNDSLLMTGYESPLFSVDYVQPRLIHPFPLQLNQTYSADYQGDGRYCGTHFERNFGSVRITADAIGTLILSEKDTLPNTLRVYTINTEAIRLNRDSCRNDSDNLKLVITEQYQWYARGYRYPVFETITSSTYDNMNHVATQQYAYRCPPIVQEVLNDSVNEQIRINDRLAGNISDDFGNNKNNPVVNNGENSNSESPNDVDSNFTYEIQTDGNRVTITYDIKTKSNVHAMVVDVLGSVYRDVQQTNQAGNGYVINIDCTGLRRGQYIIYINVNGTIFSKKIPVK